jgi:hypothetical protein
VDKAIFVKEIYSSHGLNEKVEGLVLGESANFVSNYVKQIPLLCILQHKVNKPGVFEGGVAAHYIRMLQSFLNLNFSTECFFDPGAGQ